MTQSEYRRRFAAVLDSMLATTLAKNADYATSSDAFKNFRLGESLGLGDLTEGILWRMSDKFARACNLATRKDAPSVPTESILDTLLDLAVYSIILHIYLSSKDPTT